MDMVEVDGFDQQNIENWSNDRFADVYSTKLSLGTICDLTEVHKRGGYYKNSRTTFKGDRTHEALTRKNFPWIEGVREHFNLTDKYTTNGFLEMMVSMRWVIR